MVDAGRSPAQIRNIIDRTQTPMRRYHIIMVIYFKKSIDNVYNKHKVRKYCDSCTCLRSVFLVESVLEFYDFCFLQVNTVMGGRARKIYVY